MNEDLRHPCDTLLIAPHFFGYAIAMREELERRGRNVMVFADRPSETTFMKALVRVSRTLAAHPIRRHTAAVIEKIRPHAAHVRDVIVIKGEAVPQSAIRALRRLLPNARFVIYLWDSFKNLPPETRHKLPLFDRCCSFDPEDCATDERLIYRPNFYLNDYCAAAAVERDIDLIFVGSIHTDRFRVISEVAAAMPAGTTFHRFMYHPSRTILRARRVLEPMFWGTPESAFAFTPLPSREVAALVRRSKAVLDVERRVQSGFTMRTIESLGARRKLVTTNAKVAEADFYDPANICIIDRDAPKIPPDFFEAPFVPPSDEIMHRYSIAGWMDDILA